MKKIKLVGILILICALGAVILQNRNPVQTHFLLMTLEMPHILLLLLTAGMGFALGLLVSLFSAKSSTPSA
ncbi:MAG: LapA family protein [Syntrophaceae bacterium]|nr:LapA family protein [Syntrophaceae bacterium]